MFGYTVLSDSNIILSKFLNFILFYQKLLSFLESL